MKDIKVIAFDADDTLWVNEPYFRETEDQFCDLLKVYLPENEISAILYKIEMKNLGHYGFGVKGFMLSMIETILDITKDKPNIKLIEKVLDLGKKLLDKPIELLDGVEGVLKALNGNYRVIMATKGDLLDQERKLSKSGLESHFHHIEIMSDKKVADYRKLLKHLDCKPEHFLMVGNSIKSDILPVLELGGYAVHVPYHTTWIHENVERTIESPNFLEAENIREVLKLLS